MNYYIINLIIIVIIIILSKLIENEKKRNRVIMILAFIQLFLFLGLRSTNVGTDLHNYIPFYDRCQDFSWSEVFTPGFKEYGYRAYNKIISMFCLGDEQLFLIITAFISLFGVYKLIKNNSKNYGLSIYIYITFNFYIFAFSGLRQSIALSIGLFALKYIKQRKLIKYILSIWLASTFHVTSLVLLPAYFLYKVNVEKKHIPLITLLFIVAFLFRNYITSIMLSVLNSVYEITDTGNGYFYLLFLLAVLIITTIFKNQLTRDNKDNNLWYNFILVATFIQLFANAQGEIARLTMYYSIYIIILIPNFIYTLKEKSQVYLGNILMYVLLFIFYLNSLQYTVSYNNYEFFKI